MEIKRYLESSSTAQGRLAVVARRFLLRNGRAVLLERNCKDLEEYLRPYVQKEVLEVKVAVGMLCAPVNVVLGFRRELAAVDDEIAEREKKEDPYRE